MGPFAAQNFGLDNILWGFANANINSGTELTVLEIEGGQLEGYRSFVFTFANGGQVTATPDDPKPGTVVGQAVNGQTVAPNTANTTATTPSANGSQPSAAAANIPAGSVTYSNTIQPLLASSCLTCHGAGMTAPDLSSYAGAKAAANAVLGAVSNTNTSSPTFMPQNGQPLGAATIAKIQAWISAGEPQ